MGFNIKNGVLTWYREEDGVTEVVIPDGVTSIGSWVFYERTNLKSIKIPDSVTSIGESAFSNCTNLTSLTIGAGISTLENVPIYCDKLKEINVSKNNSIYLSVNGVLFNKTITELIRFPKSYIDAKYMIPESVTSIGDSAFSCCKSLTDITIPDSVTSIGEWAFSCCKSLTDITIPDGVTSIERSAFNGCTSLVSINIPDSVTSIGDNAFWNCKGLKGITIPESVTSIGGSAFLGCESLKSITIPDSVTGIGALAFGRGTKMTFTENGISYTIKLEDYWNYNSEEKRLNNFVFEKDNAKRQEIFTQMKKASYKIPFALFMMSAYDDEFFKAYVKKTFSKVMAYIIDNNDISMLLKIFETGFLTKKNIDKHINYSIENTQNGGSLELQMTLMRYKHDNFPDTGDKTKKFRI